MLKPTLPGLSIALLLCCPIAHAGSTTHKCTDGKKITYANIPCEDMGLKSAGSIKDAVTVVPATKPQGNTPEKSGKQHNEKNNLSGSDDSVGETSGAQKIKPINPLIEKLLQ